MSLLIIGLNYLVAKSIKVAGHAAFFSDKMIWRIVGESLIVASKS